MGTYRRISAAIALLLSLTMMLTGCQGVFEKLGFGEAADTEKGAATEKTPVQTQPIQKTEPPTTVPVEETEPVQTLPPETEPSVVRYWICAEGGLNVRSGPGQNYASIGRLEDGTEIVPLKWSDGWAYIEQPLVGWCSGEYLFDTPPEYQSGEGAYWIKKDTTAHAGPGADYAISAWLDAGLAVSIVEWDGNWGLAIREDRTFGWCYADDLLQTDPFPIKDAKTVLSPQKPKDQSLVGEWMMVTDYLERSDDYFAASCDAGLLILRADGMFEHWMSYCVRYKGGGWGYPGGDDTGNDSPYWVGEYTYDGQTLVLHYKVIEVNVCSSDWANSPIPWDVHWESFEKTVTLRVTVCAEGITVDAPGKIPTSIYYPDGSDKTNPMLYRMPENTEVYDMLAAYFS